MRLTAKSEYGLLALIDLACRHGAGPISVREISERQGVPANFLEQLLVSLRRAGIVTSVRGARGGFELGKDPDAITVLDAVEALEGPLVPTLCSPDRECGRSHACAAAVVWERAADGLRGVLQGTTLSDLASAQTRLDAGKGA
ncbi:MAG: Rrf2 family transcriptional regulator [Coriobacteriia bacterium]|nr:Rrf2 family transcriptional regulator [Coriobacteriia bacterium]